MKQAYLLLARPDPAGPYRVRLADDLTDALRDWDGSTRLSPLYVADAASTDALPTVAFDGAHTLLFAGPAHPAIAVEQRPAGAALWLTLGAFNLVLYAAGNHAAAFDAWARGFGLRFECWTLQDGARTAVTYSAPVPADSARNLSLVRLAGAQRHAALDEAIKEFAPLMASTLARAAEVYPVASPELARLVDFVREDLQETVADEATDEQIYETLGRLTTVNAGLSRFSSQAFSGVTPLTDTESHYWTHSLLGTGVANLALLRFCDFAFERLGEARIPQRLEALERRTLDVDARLETLHDRHDWWEEDDVGRVRLSPAEERTPLGTVITCFSGRDGYKSTLQTLSAPLAVIGACNSLRWTLLTLTHEVSHIAVRGALAVLYPRLTADDVERAHVRLKATPTNLLDAARRYLLVTVSAMHQIDQGAEVVDTSPRALPALLNRWAREVEELMVHVFDFLYFYGGDPAKYVRGIWLSWSVIPNIAHRVPEYVLRTLCAVMVNHLRRGPEIETTARDQVRAALEALVADGHGGQYVRDALHHLAEDWDDIQPRLLARRGIVRIVRKFLYSPRIAARVRGESEIGGGTGRDGYSLRVGEFVDTPVGNPLRFVETYTQAVQPSVLHSMWMLTILAFNVRPETEAAAATRPSSPVPTIPEAPATPHAAPPALPPLTSQAHNGQPAAPPAAITPHYDVAPPTGGAQAQNATTVPPVPPSQSA